MSPARPMLGEIELQQVQTIEVDGDQVLVEHGVPALEGDYFQGLGRRATQVTLTGVLTGPESGEGLRDLREKFRAAEPVPFVADIATATRVDEVLIEEMGVRELAGKPERFEYAFTLREYTAPPAPEVEEPPEPDLPDPPDDDIDDEVGTLIVEVIVEGQPGFDFSRVTVTARGTQEDGTDLSRTLTNREDNTWTEEAFPAGQYTVEAVVTELEAMSGAEPATVRAGQTTQVTITLRPGAMIAKTFMVHFWFDKAFVEPCMGVVLRQVAQYAQAHADEKLVIVGHTDLVGSGAYNQSLSERRGRSVYAYLTFGRDQATALNEWDQLRRARPAGTLPSINDTWGTREYQYMLQELGYYPGNVDEVHGPATDAAVRAFQGDQGLTADGVVGDDTWAALIEAYMNRDGLAVPESQFLPNCEGEILKWLGCGEQDPVRNTQDAWRPNRRTELLFVRADALPCEVAQPETYDLPAAGAVGSGWCLGPGDPNQRCCFTTREAEQEGKWLVQPAEPGTVTVRGSVAFEDGMPAGDVEYVLIAPDGEFMDGERPSGPERGRPILGRTAADGTFAYPDKPKGIGVYTLELRGPFVARLDGEPPEAAKGSVVCKRLDGTSDFDVVVLREACRLLGSVHFEFDKSFVRPAGRRPLEAAADSVQRAPASWRLLPVGHTDMMGREAYNDELGVRRAKAVYAYYTGNLPDPDNPGRSIWLNLYHDPRESWGAREIQYMLRDLGFYCHHLSGAFDAQTRQAVRAFKNDAGLGDNEIVDDAFLDRLFGDYTAHNGASIPDGRFLVPHRWLSCGEHHPIDVRGGAPFQGRSETNRRVELLLFPQPPRTALGSPTDCSQYPTWNEPCDRQWLAFIGPKRNPSDPADVEEQLAFLEVANWENAFDYDPPDANGHRHPTGDQPRADFIDRDPDRFFVQITDLDQQGAGMIRARIKTVDDADSDVNPLVESELGEDANRPGVFRSNSLLLVADEIDNGEIPNGSAAGATPFRVRGIANGDLDDPLLRAQIGGQVVVEYGGSELGRIPVCDADCIKTIPMNIVILRKTDGTAVTTEADIEERVRRLQQSYMQCCIRFDVTIQTAAAGEMPAGVLLSDVSGLSVSSGVIGNRAALSGEERALFESELNIRRTTPARPGRTDTVQIFYANRLDGVFATATSYPIVRYGTPADDLVNTVIVGADADENSTLPHEMLHILLNSPHDASSQIRTNLFFESALGQPDFADTTVTSKKRIPEAQCETIMNNVSEVVP